MIGVIPHQFYRVILAIIAAAVLACIFTILTATGERAEGRAASTSAPNRTLAEPRCSQRGWPYYEPHCVRDPRLGGGERMQMRTVTTERW